MIRALLPLAAGVLFYATVGEWAMARDAQRFGEFVFDHPGPVLPHLLSVGRGGDHLLQVTKNLVASRYGRPLNDDEVVLLRRVVAEVDREINAGHAGDRLRMLRAKP